jgi:CspA family cold shock protein
VVEVVKVTSKPEKVYERIQAQVKFYDRAKGFGFIKRPNKDDIYISGNQLLKDGIDKLREDDRVEFDLVPVPGKGGRAINIKRVKK